MFMSFFGEEEVKVVVRARIRCRCHAVKDDSDYIFRKGDLGILKWYPNPNSVGLWMPVVVWDEDPSKMERFIRAEIVEIVGSEMGLDRHLFSLAPQ